MRKLIRISIVSIIVLSIILSMSNCKEDSEDTNNNVEKNITIIFNTNGGNNVSSKIVSYNSKLGSIESEKTGYSFKGWFLDEDFNKPFDINKPISEQIIYKENITLYAKFSQKLYRVIYDGDENTEGEVPVDDNLYAEGDMFKPVWAHRLRKNLYPFQGWLVTGASLKSSFYYRNEQKNIFYAYFDSIIFVGNSDINFKALYNLNTVDWR